MPTIHYTITRTQSFESYHNTPIEQWEVSTEMVRPTCCERFKNPQLNIEVHREYMPDEKMFQATGPYKCGYYDYDNGGDYRPTETFEPFNFCPFCGDPITLVCDGTTIIKYVKESEIIPAKVIPETTKIVWKKVEVDATVCLGKGKTIEDCNDLRTLPCGCIQCQACLTMHSASPTCTKIHIT